MQRKIIDGYESDLFNEQPERKHIRKIDIEFTVPPFSVLDARSGAWQARKREWVRRLGIQPELGRAENLIGGKSPLYNGFQKKTVGQEDRENLQHGLGTSIFDPFLCEIVYSWYGVPCGQVVDPFSGGSVRGVVASHCEMNYWGCDIRHQQIESNRQQAADICNSHVPQYVLGNALEVCNTLPESDLVFTCPPYWNLEKYSDIPEDLSNTDYETFSTSMKSIIELASKSLCLGGFSVYVIGNMRNKNGVLVDLAGLVVEAHEEAGLAYWNEHILITPIGTVAMRAGKQFRASKKTGRCHQTVLVFKKVN